MFLSKPVVGTKQLRSLAGSLSFIASIIPPMRPFLSALWAVLGSANDGSKTSGKLIHTKRIASALEWILSVLVNFSQRTLWVPQTGVSCSDSNRCLHTRTRSSHVHSRVLTCRPCSYLHRFNAQNGDPQFMCLWESICLLIAARLWLSRLPLGTVARVRADNLAALHMLRKGVLKAQT